MNEYILSPLSISHVITNNSFPKIPYREPLNTRAQHQFVLKDVYSDQTHIKKNLSLNCIRSRDE